jgi:ribosomal protein S4E
MIQYVYVDRDCTVTRGATSWTKTDDERGTYTVKYNAIDLQLKEGWNLVQQNQNSTKTEDTITMKIADKDIPWYIRRTGN